jgi:hypothetical protein
MRLAGLLLTTPLRELRPTREQEEDLHSFRPQQTDAIHWNAKGEQRTQRSTDVACPLGNGRRIFHKRCGSLYASPTVDALLRFPARGRTNDRVGAGPSALPEPVSARLLVLSEGWTGFLASKWKERGGCC